MGVIRSGVEMILPGGYFATHPKVPVAIGGAALGVMGLALEYNPFGIEDTLNIDAGHGTLERVYELPFPKECNDAFQSKVEDASAKYSKKITIGRLHIPLGYSDTETFGGDITSEVCRDATEVKVKLDEKSKKVTVAVPGDAYHTTDYMTDPTSAPFTTEHNGPTEAAVKIFETQVHVLPFVKYQGVTDSLSGRLRSYALLAAQDTASEGCGKEAWKYLRPMEEDAIKQEVVRWAHALNPDLVQLSTDDVTVELPGDDEVTLKDQYGDALEKIKDAAGSSLTVTIPQEAGTCQASDKLAAFMAAHPTGHATAATAPAPSGVGS